LFIAGSSFMVGSGFIVGSGFAAGAAGNERASAPTAIAAATDPSSIPKRVVLMV
jgi:hypothetical protein